MNWCRCSGKSARGPRREGRGVAAGDSARRSGPLWHKNVQAQSIGRSVPPRNLIPLPPGSLPVRPAMKVGDNLGQGTRQNLHEPASTASQGAAFRSAESPTMTAHSCTIAHHGPPSQNPLPWFRPPPRAPYPQLLLAVLEPTVRRGLIVVLGCTSPSVSTCLLPAVAPGSLRPSITTHYCSFNRVCSSR
jgi:hypothetical protein